jgi:hypothetical protein
MVGGCFGGWCLQEEPILRQDDARVGAIEVLKCDKLERAMENTEMECFANHQQHMNEDGDAESNEEVRGAGRGGVGSGVIGWGGVGRGVVRVGWAVRRGSGDKATNANCAFHTRRNEQF